MHKAFFLLSSFCATLPLYGMEEKKHKETTIATRTPQTNAALRIKALLRYNITRPDDITNDIIINYISEGNIVDDELLFLAVMKMKSNVVEKL